MRKVWIVLAAAMLCASAEPAHAGARRLAQQVITFTWNGPHAIPRQAGTGWCRLGGPHQHPYRPTTDMPVQIRGGAFVYVGEVPLPPPPPQRRVIIATPPAPPPPPPPPAPVYVPAPQDLAAHRVEAEVVRARVIWAKEIKADDVRCPNVVIQRLGPVARGWEGEIQSDRIDAGVVRAHEIRARIVEAEEIHAERIKSKGGGKWGHHRKWRDRDDED